MNSTEARINELNICKRLLEAEKGRCRTSPEKYLHHAGLDNAVRILMERKKELRAKVSPPKVAQ